MSRASECSSENFQCLFENDLLGVVVLRDGAVAVGNRCFAQMLGRQQAGLQGMALADLAATPESRDVVRDLVDSGQCAAGRSGEFILSGSEAAPVACRFNCAQHCPGQGGEPSMHVLLVQDISEYYRLAEEYNKSMLDLEEAKLVQEENANTLSDMLVQLELAEQAKLEKEKLQGIVELAIAAAHELSQPLQAVQNDVYFLRSSLPAGGEEEQALDAIDGALADLEQTITKIRRITSYTSTEYAKNTRMFDLGGSSGGEDPDKED